MAYGLMSECPAYPFCSAWSSGLTSVNADFAHLFRGNVDPSIITTSDRQGDRTGTTNCSFLFRSSYGPRHLLILHRSTVYYYNNSIVSCTRLLGTLARKKKISLQRSIDLSFSRQFPTLNLLDLHRPPVQQQSVHCCGAFKPSRISLYLLQPGQTQRAVDSKAFWSYETR